MLKLTQPKVITDLAKDDVIWVQNQLKIGGFYSGKIDGIAGKETLKALADFKKKFYLEYPDIIGASTLDSLNSLVERDEISEQSPVLPKRNPEAGQRSGKSAHVPNAGIVYVNQHIWDGIPLTWGEVTKDLTRIPINADVTKNLVQLAKVFGKVRDKFDSPLYVTSGYRPAHLKIGASRSQHIPGRALDLMPVNGNFRKLLEVYKAVPEIKGIGLGQSKGFLHMDIRPKTLRGGKFDIWDY